MGIILDPAGNEAGFLSDRRRSRRTDSPAAQLARLPALTILDRIPFPVLAVAHDGSIVFANSAFGEMLGYSVDALLRLRADDIFDDRSRSAFLRGPRRNALSHQEVLLKHAEGYYARTIMSSSALRRHDDAVTLVTFQDLTDSLWSSE